MRGVGKDKRGKNQTKPNHLPENQEENYQKVQEVEAKGRVGSRRDTFLYRLPGNPKKLNSVSKIAVNG